MKIAYKFACVTAVVLSAATFADTPSSALGQLLQGFTTFTADFAQVVKDDKGSTLQQNHGQVQLARPGRFRWVSLVPTKQIITANGPTLWTYDVDLEQATKQPFQATGGVTPAALLSGQVSDLQQKFNVEKVPSQGQDQAFKLTPKQPSDLFKSVQMTFAGDRLQAMQVLNNLGQTVSFRFSNVKLNPKLDKNLFNFTPPTGVDVIDNA